MIRFYKAVTKILRTLKSYLTGAGKEFESKQPLDKWNENWTLGVDLNDPELRVKKVPRGRIIPFAKEI